MANSHPWTDWTPGALNSRQVKELCDHGLILNTHYPEIDHSSIDLTLTNEVYEMTLGAVKPSGRSYLPNIKRDNLAKQVDDEDGEFILRSKTTYLIKIRERLDFPSNSGIYGQATAKSSVGRVDVLARLIVDGADGYEHFLPKPTASGDMFLEVTPLTFNVKVKPGISLSQLRFFYGAPRISEVPSCREAHESFLKGSLETNGQLSLDLTPTKIAGKEVIAFRAIRNPDLGPVPLWESSSKPDPLTYWEFVEPSTSSRLTLEKDAFFILRSKEKITLPPGIAVYCRAIDEVFGEMRIHYAGFVHPHFGRNRTDGTSGTPLIFEVRGHDVNASLCDGEKMARLIFYRMSEDAPKSDTDATTTPYEEQTLQLSKFFEEWPQTSAHSR